jgi:DNA polymerase III epsilon subunit-like protein
VVGVVPTFGASVIAWLKGRAGRRVRIKVDDLEAEASTAEDVQALLRAPLIKAEGTKASNNDEKIVIDTEITGLEPLGRDRMAELGAAELINCSSTGNTFHRYVCPQRATPAGASGNQMFRIYHQFSLGCIISPASFQASPIKSLAITASWISDSGISNS